jgi:hypothetical protein
LIITPADIDYFDIIIFAITLRFSPSHSVSFRQRRYFLSPPAAADAEDYYCRHCRHAFAITPFRHFDFRLPTY